MTWSWTESCGRLGVHYLVDAPDRLNTSTTMSCRDAFDAEGTRLHRQSFTNATLPFLTYCIA